MKGSTIFFIAFVVGVVLVVGQAQSRFDSCKQIGQKTIACALGLG